MTRFLTGLTILFIAQVLSAFMGLYIENTYATFGNNYREGLFYTVCSPPVSPLPAQLTPASTHSPSPSSSFSRAP